MKHHNLIPIALILCLAMFCCGCFGSRNKRLTTQFYTINYNAPVKTTVAPIPVLISIEPFEAIPPYDSSRIIFTTSLFTMNSYSYHEWMALPAEMTTFLFARDMRSADIVKGVMVGDDRMATHRILGRVESFCEQDRDEGWEALLSISISLVKLNEVDVTKQLSFQKTYTLTEPCPEKNPKGLAMAMSAAMSKISLELISDLQKTLSN